MPAFVGFYFPPSPIRCLLCIGTDFIKMKSEFDRTCALRRKLKRNFCEIALSFKPPA